MRSWQTSARFLNLIGTFWCVAALLIAVLFMEKYLGLAPCPLCVLDRVVIAVMALVFMAASLHKPSRVAHRVYSGGNLLLGLIGVAISGRHVYLQALPPDKIPDCAPDLGYMLDAFPLTKTLLIVFNTSGTCAEINWTFAGFSIAQQTLFLFIALSGFCVFIFTKSGNPEVDVTGSG